MDEASGEKPKLHIDEDWKSQAQAEKERLEQAKAARPKAEPEPPAQAAEAAAPLPSDEHERRLPPPTLDVLITTLATQAMMLLGQIPNPMTGKAEFDLPQAQHFVDTLAMLEQKTAGNRTPGETRLLDNLLHELRMVFVQMTARSGSSPPK